MSPAANASLGVIQSVNSIFFTSRPCAWARSIAKSRMSPNGPAGEPIFSGASAAWAVNGSVAAMAIKLRRLVWQKTFSVVIEQPSETVAAKLHEGNQGDQDDDHADHDAGGEALVTVTDCQVAQPACTDGTRHGRRANHRHQRNGKTRQQAGKGLGH